VVVVGKIVRQDVHPFKIVKLVQENSLPLIQGMLTDDSIFRLVVIEAVVSLVLLDLLIDIIFEI